MKKVYDRFADEYIKKRKKSPYAPPERYTEITEEVLVENAARWFLAALKRLLDEETDHKTENRSEKPNNSTISKMEQVEDEPMKTTDYCDICKRDMCEYCIADATNPYCVPSHYEINYEPKDEPKTQTETQNSNSTFEKADEPQTDCPWK